MDADQALLRQELAASAEEYAPYCAESPRNTRRTWNDSRGISRKRGKPHARHVLRRAASAAAATVCELCVRKRGFFSGAQLEKRAKVRKNEVNSLLPKRLPRVQSFALAHLVREGVRNLWLSCRQPMVRRSTAKGSRHRLAAKGSRHPKSSRHRRIVQAASLANRSACTRATSHM